jgi:hypothetical protein
MTVNQSAFPYSAPMEQGLTRFQSHPRHTGATKSKLPRTPPFDITHS